METEYFISFICGYACRVSAICIEDAVVIAKAYAIDKGYSKPSVESIKIFQDKIELPGKPFDSGYDMVPDNITCL